MKKRARKRNESLGHYAQYLVKEWGQAVLLMDFTEPCPRRGGPDHPHPDYPGMIGRITCRGCRFQGLLYADGFICSHPGAKRVSAETLKTAQEKGKEECQTSFL